MKESKQKIIKSLRISSEFSDFFQTNQKRGIHKFIVINKSTV